MINQFNYLFVTLFIFGKNIEKYRGTWASLFTTLLLFSTLYILKINPLFITTLIFIIAIYSFFAIGSCLKQFKEDDPQEIVIDEFVGQSIPICLFEIFHHSSDKSYAEALQIYFVMFLLFRLFDGLKPFPIDYFDRNYKNSFGILFDDILAGSYVVACMILFMIGKTLFF